MRAELRALHARRVASTLTTRSPRSASSATTAAQQRERVGAAPALVGVGEVLADVAEARGAEQRVDHGVREHVGVGVPVEAALVLDLDAAEDQPARPSTRRCES